MFRLRNYYLACCDSAERLVGPCDVEREKKAVNALFDNWISEYELTDEYPLNSELNKVYRRNFVGPVRSLSDYRTKGFGEAIDEYEKKTAALGFRMFGLTDGIVAYIDGKRTVGEIIRLVSLETRQDVTAASQPLFEVLEKIGLISEI